MRVPHIFVAVFRFALCLVVFKALLAIYLVLFYLVVVLRVIFIWFFVVFNVVVDVVFAVVVNVDATVQLFQFVDRKPDMDVAIFSAIT
jgi:hypothetical protein